MAGTADLLDLGGWLRLARSNRAATLVVLGLLLGMLALVGPWFSIDVFRSGSHDPVIDFTTSSVVGRDSDGSYYVLPYSSSSCNCATVAGTFDLVLLIVGLAVVVGAATGVAMRWGILRGELRLALAALCGLLLILGPVVLAASLPGALAADDLGQLPGQSQTNWERSFMGQNTSLSTITISWGPSWGWVASLIGGVMVLGGVLLARRPPGRPAAAVAPVPAATAPAPAAGSPAIPDASGGGSFPSPAVGGETPLSGGR